MNPMRVLLVDDHALFRQGVQALLAARPGIEIIGTAGDGLEALAFVRQSVPDVILMDVEMPRCGGLEATRRIKAEFPQVKIVMLTVNDDDQTVFEAIKNGAQGYLLKSLEARQLYEMLDGLREGEAPLSGSIAAKILREFKTVETAAPNAGQKLTEREHEVLELLVQGLSNREIADTLVIAENTVKTYLSSILEKLHLHNRIQVAVYAVTQGLVHPGDSK